MAYADGNIIIGTSVDMYGMNTGLKKIEKSVRKLQAMLGAALGVAGFAQLGKAAIDAASDLQEVQNIVDVTFEDMNWKIENFAETCIDKFGMSELAAKQTAGSFMAMGRSMGLTNEEASNMAVKLTALTGDFASFYNISQDYARVALSAVYTGETETLKRYGIILTQANLQEYASTLGIEKKVKAMSAREKLLLRYNYILQTTSYIEGDFVRTQDNWANQVRVLQQRWKQLLITLGNGLIQVLTPMVKVLNQIVAALIRFANIIGQILSRLFGIGWRGISDDANALGKATENAAGGVGNLADEEEDLAGAADKATKAAKKQLAPFDELNNIMEHASDSAGGLGSGLDGLAGGLEDDLGDLTAGGKKLDFDLPKIFDLFDLGRWLSMSLADMLESIDWQSIFKKAKRFGEGLADFLNGLITPRLFKDLGMTIANAINTAIYAALAFGNRFNWTNLGRSIAAGINEFFATFDFESLAKTINVWAKGLLTTIIKILDDVDWYAIGEKLGTLIAGIDWIGILKKVGEALLKAAAALSDMFTGFMSKAPLEGTIIAFGGLITLLTSSKFQKAIKIGKAFFGVFSAKNAKELKASKAVLSNMSPALSGLASALDAVRTAWGTSGGSIGTFFTNLRDLMSPLAKGIIGVTSVLIEFGVVFSTFKDMTKDMHDGVDAVDTLKEHLGLLLGVLAAVTAALTLIFGFPAGLIIAGVTLAVGAIAGFVAAMHEIDASFIERAFERMAKSSEDATHSLSDYLELFDSMGETATLGIDDVNKSFENLEKSRNEVDQTNEKIGTIHMAMQSEVGLTTLEVEKLGECIDGVKEEMEGLVSAFYDTLIQQAKADYMYLTTTQGYSDQLKQEYSDRIAILMQNKQTAVDNAGEAAAAEKAAYDAYNEAFTQYNNALTDTSMTADQVAEKEQNLVTKQQELYDAIGKGLEITTKYGAASIEVKDQVGDFNSEIERLEGKLDLASQEIYTADDALAAFQSTTSTLKNKYEDLNKELTELLESQKKDLETAQNTGDKAAISQAESSIAISEQKMQELHDVYTTELGLIEDDVKKLGPRMLQAFDEEYDADEMLQKMFPNKDTYLQEKMNEFVSQIFEGDGGLTATLNEAWEAAGEDTKSGAEGAAKAMVDAMFTTIEEYVPTAYGQTKTVKTAMSDIGKDCLDGVYDGITDPPKSALIGDGIKQVIDTNIIDKAKDELDSHSPSKVMEDIGKDAVDGLNKGIEEASSDTETTVVRWITVVKTTIGRELETFNTNYKDTTNKVVTAATTMATSVLQTTTTKLKDFFKSIYNEASKLESDTKTLWSPFTNWVNSGIISPTKSKFADFLNYMTNNIINPFKNAWVNAINVIKSAFSSLASYIKSAMSSAMNSVLNTVESGLNALNDGLSRAASNMQKLSSGASSFQNINIPQLATGAVIPPNKPFMALLGDQKSGTNIEAPLSTIQQAVANTINSMGLGGSNEGDIVIQIDGYEVFRAMRNQSDLFRGSTGYGAL